MLKFALFLLVLFAVAFGFQRLKHIPGELALKVGDTVYAVDLTTAVIAFAVAVVAALIVILMLRAIFAAPGRFAGFWRNRTTERGRTAVSQGLVAVAAGDVRTAERAVLEAGRRTPDLPLTRLLEAQTAQLKGDHAAARRTFQAMTEDPRTRMAGLRGLYVEAERENEREAAFQIAARAHEETPTSPWAARALLRHQAAASDWGGALATLSAAADARVFDKPTARRQRAVILTAQALALEDGDPDRARHAALEAHDLAPDLVPAAVVAGRLLSRQGDIRRATRVLEAAWKASPHPDITEAYMHVRAGDSAADRLKRAETLMRMRADADEGRLAAARAAIAAREFRRAVDVLTPVLTTRPTQRALMTMAELEEAATGDRGRAREWLARAVRAPRDPVWTADGVILDAWAPASPVTGRIDAVEWKVPVAELEPPRIEIDASELEPPPEPEQREPPQLPAAPAAPPPAAVPAQPAEVAPPAPARPPADAEAPRRTNGGHAPPEPPRAPAAAAASTPRPEPPPAPPLPDDPGVDDAPSADRPRRLF
jgi:HemY protein